MKEKNPFLGPKSYEEEDDFFGREKEKKEVTNLIRNETLTLLFSRSGTGKSSLVKAGLIPLLRRDFEYLPVYIHLNDSKVNENSSDNLCEYVIDRCKEEINKHFSQSENVNVVLPELYHKGSLFEFLSTISLTQRDNNDKYIIKPLIIFDQFEEIFTHLFSSDKLKFLISELRCLIESQLPDYLNAITPEAFSKIKNGLISKQKNYRILFSFREEFLPHFESLRAEIPFIQFTNSRYRLESFSKATANEVIIDTDRSITEPVASEIVENLAINILANFEKVVVEPFLLSLVCQKIYHNVLNLKDESQEEKAETIKKLVDSAIENYIDDIYKKISERTKEFIEIELITSDKKRTPFNYNDATADSALKKEIDMLIDEPMYRLLNKEEFLDSPHIEILHDRLLPPLAIRREERLKKLEEIKLENKQKEFQDQQKEKRQKKNIIILLIALFAAAVTVFILLNQQRALNNANDNLNENAKLLRAQSDSLKSKTIALRDSTDKLKKTSLFLEVSRNSLRDAITNLQQITLKKDKSLSYFHGVADTNINFLIKQNPLKALAEAQANYERLKAIYPIDNDIVKKFEKTYLKAFNNNPFYFRESTVPFNSIIPVGGTFFMRPKAYDKDPAKIGFKIDTNQFSIADQIMLIDIKDQIVKHDVLTLITSHPDSTTNNFDRQLNKFRVSENFVYVIRRNLKDNYLLGDTILLWKIQENLFRKTPVVIPIIFNKPIKTARNRSITNLKIQNLNSDSKYYSVAYLDSANIVHAIVYDFKRDLKINNDFKLVDKLLRIYSIDPACSEMITNSSDPHKLRLYKGDKNYLIGENEAEKDFSRAFFYNGKIITYAEKSKSFLLEFRDLRGVLTDSLVLPERAKTYPDLMFENSIVAFGKNNNILFSTKLKYGYKTITINNSNGSEDEEMGSPTYYAVSEDKSLLAYVYNENSVAIVDLNKGKVLKTFTVREPVVTTPSFYGKNNLTVVAGDNLYRLYYKSLSKADSVEEIKGKLKTLLKEDYKNYQKELEKYQVGANKAK